MTFDITQVVIALVGLLAAVVTGFAIPWLRSKLGAAQFAQLVEVARVAVLAAEQLGATDVIQDKLSYAAAQVKAALAKQGLHYDDELVRVAIEAAVLKFT